MSLTIAPPPAAVTVDVQLAAAEWDEALRVDALLGLADSPKWLPPTWLYDDRGSGLFDEITRLPEYYPTRAERSILAAHAAAITQLCQAEVLVELGAGTADKTRVLLDAMRERGGLAGYVPFDVSEQTLRSTCASIGQRYPGVAVHGVVGDFRYHLESIPTRGPRLWAFLGGTIGNFRPAERFALLTNLADVMQPGDTLLVGTDLVKDRGRLLRAYDDAAGVTAAFNLNVLAVLNRELGADFDITAFEHVARFDETEEWIEMRLRSLRSQTVSVSGLGLSLRFDRGEDLLTEISAKFQRGRFDEELCRAGLSPIATLTDRAGDYQLVVAAK